MNSKKFITATFLLVFAGILSGTAGAQEKAKGEKEFEKQIQVEIDQHKKEMAEQRRMLEEQLKLNDHQLRSIDEARKRAKEMQSIAQEKSREVIRDFRLNRDNLFPFGGSYFHTPEGFYFLGHDMNDDVERTAWTFSKSIKENSFSRDYSFDVEKSATSVVMSVNGNCKEGEIRINIVMPDGKTYSDIVIDESGNLN